MVRSERIDHRSHRHNREDHSGRAANIIAKIQQAYGEPTKDDGEVEPREEGALVGEEDFGFDADGEGDAFLGG